MENIKEIQNKCKDLSILYVEDNEKVRLQTSKVLNIYFHKIFLASNGKEAIDIFNNEKIDIIFTDVNMPKMDGISMIELIRKKDINIPIVIFSAYDNTEYLLKTIEFGIDGYILKPFKLDQIQSVIEKIIKKLATVSVQCSNTKLIDNFIWDNNTYTLYKDSKHIKLTKNETKLFKLLSSSRNILCSSEDIEIELFDDNYNDNKRVRGLISRLHKKLGTHLIKSKYGEGYELNLEE
ncbi:response regulator transcription factor [Halarcobacter sp.]|uniref:response regulator transcription factor n=1 Tax=Halarcobacter sp. TaxID=2321133 RepID=UPI0029F48759|nr:response regulator transcription factor [Halarcobacter sp.]